MNNESGRREQMEPIAAPKMDVSEHFKYNLSNTLETLGKQSLETIRFLPSFVIDSKIGELKAGVTLSPAGSTDFPSELCSVRVKNEYGQIVALRIATLFSIPGKNELHAGAGIEVGLKAKGLAVPTDLIFIQVLQCISDSEQKKIVWELHNANAEDLDQLISMFKAKGIDVQDIRMIPEVIELEEEQVRWQAVYGQGGKLGINKMRKVFTPMKRGDQGTIDTIILRRVEDPETKVVSSEVVSVINSNDPEELLAERRGQLLRDIEENKMQ